MVACGGARAPGLGDVVEGARGQLPPNSCSRSRKGRGSGGKMFQRSAAAAAPRSARGRSRSRSRKARSSSASDETDAEIEGVWLLNVDILLTQRFYKNALGRIPRCILDAFSKPLWNFMLSLQAETVEWPATLHEHIWIVKHPMGLGC